jgi:hypothetical protein
MTDEQRPLIGYKGKVQEAGEFANPNEGKPVLNENDEYILRLVAFPKVKTFKQPKEKKSGEKYFEDVDKAICEFEETGTKNIVTAFFRVDKLNFSDDDSFRSAVIRFFAKIGHMLPENVYPDWENYFVVGMRFRARVVVGVDKTPTGKIPNGHYYLDIPTCRKLLQTDGSEGDTSVAKPKPDEGANLLANALLLAKGCKDNREAIVKLQDLKVPKDVFMAFFQADQDGKVNYPI